MTEGVLDFPFVATLPKKEKSKFATVWDRFQQLSKLSEEKGMLVPVRLAAKVIGVSRVRVYELIKAGRLEVCDVDGEIFATENSIVEYARSERKAGRPMSVPNTTAEVWKVAKNYAKGK